MYKFVVLYFTPKDPSHFRNYYESTHVHIGVHPLIKRRWYTFDVQSLNDKALPADSGVFCYYEAEFEDEAAFQACVRDESSKAAAADTSKFATGGMLALHFNIP